MRSTFRRPSAHHTERAARPCRRCPRLSDYGLAGRRHPRVRLDRRGRTPRVGVERLVPATSRRTVLCDGGPFVSQADKNATWTILALACERSINRQTAQAGEYLELLENGMRSTLGRCPAAVGFTWTPPRGTRPPGRDPCAKGDHRRPIPSNRNLHAARVGAVRGWCISFSEDERSGVRPRAGPEFIDFVMPGATVTASDRAATDGHARRHPLGSTRSAAGGSTRLCRCTAAERRKCLMHRLS